MDREVISRPFTSREKFQEPSPAGYAELYAGMLADLDTELPERIAEASDRDHDLGSMFRHLDELAIAFDMIAAFDSHGYQELKRPAYFGDDWLKAKIWFPKHAIQNEPEESRHDPDGVNAEHVEILRLADEDAIHGTDNTPSAEWRSVRDVPACALGPVTAGGAGR